MGENEVHDPKVVMCKIICWHIAVGCFHGD